MRDLNQLNRYRLNDVERRIYGTHDHPRTGRTKMNDHIEVLRGAVARGWCSPENAGKTVDPVLAEAIVQEVIAAIAAMGGQGEGRYPCPRGCDCRGRDCPDCANFTDPHQPEAQAVPVAWIRTAMLETQTGEVDYLVRVGTDQQHPDDVPLYRTPPAKVPEGYVLVPVEPTDHMGKIGGIWARNSSGHYVTERDVCKAMNIYRAMLAAAPAPKEDA